jgi:hypothetical protein
MRTSVRLALLLGLSCYAEALRNERAAALRSSMAFAGPAPVRHGGAPRKGICGMHMQQPPQNEAACASASADKRHLDEFSGEAGASAGSAPPSSDEEQGLLREEQSGDTILASRRAAISVGLGLVLGPMIPMLTTALTGEPAAHAATGAAQPGDGDRKPFVQKSLKEVLSKAGSRALGGGRSGRLRPLIRSCPSTCLPGVRSLHPSL